MLLDVTDIAIIVTAVVHAWLWYRVGYRRGWVADKPADTYLDVSNKTTVVKFVADTSDYREALALAADRLNDLAERYPSGPS